MSALTITVLSNGEPLRNGDVPPSEPALLMVDVVKEVNRITTARLVFIDGDLAAGTFPLSDSKQLDPGARVEIKLRPGDAVADTTVFIGLVTRHGVAAGPGGSQLVVELKDAAVKLTHTRRSRVFTNQTDAAAIDAILRDDYINDLDDWNVEENVSLSHPELIQYRVTDWDFILSRAEALGMVVVADGGIIRVTPVEVVADANHTLDIGIDEIYEFEHEIDSTSQVGGVEARGWDRQALTLTEATGAREAALSHGDLRRGDVAQNLGLQPRQLVHPVALGPDELAAWATGALTRSQLAMVRGRITTAGRAEVNLLDTAEVVGMGSHFSGRALITGVRHRIDESGWRTDVQLGLDPEILCRRHDVQEEPASGMLPAATGLQVGVVADFEEDDSGEYRLRVKLPAIGDGNESAVWATLSQVGAGTERGLFFRPDPGDEVIVGFIGDDPRRPVVLGALYGPANALPKEVRISGDNAEKALVARSGAKLSFVDAEKPAVFVSTPAGYEIVLAEDTGEMRLSDPHGNSITMSSDGITVSSGRDLVLQAPDGNVMINGKTVDIQ